MKPAPGDENPQNAPLTFILTSYPLSCVRLQPVQRCPRVDLQGALGSFLSDVRDRLQSVCGFPARLTGKPRYGAVTASAAATLQVRTVNLFLFPSSCLVKFSKQSVSVFISCLTRSQAGYLM